MTQRKTQLGHMNVGFCFMNQKKKKMKTPYLVKPIRKEEKRPVKEKEFC